MRILRHSFGVHGIFNSSGCATKFGEVVYWRLSWCILHECQRRTAYKFVLRQTVLVLSQSLGMTSNSEFSEVKKKTYWLFLGFSIKVSRVDARAKFF